MVGCWWMFRGWDLGVCFWPRERTSARLQPGQQRRRLPLLVRDCFAAIAAGRTQASADRSQQDPSFNTFPGPNEAVRAPSLHPHQFSPTNKHGTVRLPLPQANQQRGSPARS